MIENKVSIIIPCYNNGYLLSKMIDIILQQTYKNWELLLVDDQSTDETPKIIKEYSEKDNRIKVFSRSRPPKGAQTCRNIGMDNATGKYMVIFDADDLISKNCIENRVQLMIKNSSFDYISFPAKQFIDDINLPSFHEKGHLYGVGSDKSDILSDLLKARYSSIVVTNIYKTTTLSKIRWDEKVKVYQDFDFAISVVLKGLKHKFSDTKEIDYFYRVGQSNSISSNFTSEEKAKSTIYLFTKILTKLKGRKDYNTRRKEFLNFVVLHYERLLIDGNTQKITEYLEFIKNHYSKYVIFRIYIIFYLTKIFNLKLRYIAVNLLISILFFKLMNLKNAIIKIIK